MQGGGLGLAREVQRTGVMRVTKIAPESHEVDAAVPVGTIGQVANDLPYVHGMWAVRWPNGWSRYYRPEQLRSLDPRVVL